MPPFQNGTLKLSMPAIRIHARLPKGHTKKTPLKGMRFESLDEAQAYLGGALGRHAHSRHDEAAGSSDVR